MLMEPAAKNDEFREVAHSGGTVTLTVMENEKGHRGFMMQWNHCRPVRAVLFAVYALPQGIPLCQMNLGGIGSVQEPPR